MSVNTGVSVQEAAAHLGVKPRSVRRYIASGRLPAYRVGPRMIRVNIADLDLLIQPVAPTGGDVA